MIYAHTRGGQTLDELRAFEALGVHSIQIGIDTLDDMKRFADDVLPEIQ